MQVTALIEEIRGLHEIERESAKLEASLFPLLGQTQFEVVRRAELVSIQLQSEALRRLRENLHQQICSLFNNSSGDSLPAFAPTPPEADPTLGDAETPLPFNSPPESDPAPSLAPLAAFNTSSRALRAKEEERGPASAPPPLPSSSPESTPPLSSRSLLEQRSPVLPTAPTPPLSSSHSEVEELPEEPAPTIRDAQAPSGFSQGELPLSDESLRALLASSEAEVTPLPFKPENAPLPLSKVQQAEASLIAGSPLPELSQPLPTSSGRDVIEISSTLPSEHRDTVSTQNQAERLELGKPKAVDMDLLNQTTIGHFGVEDIGPLSDNEPRSTSLNDLFPISRGRIEDELPLSQGAQREAPPPVPLAPLPTLDTPPLPPGETEQNPFPVTEQMKDLPFSPIPARSLETAEPLSERSLTPPTPLPAVAMNAPTPSPSISLREPRPDRRVLLVIKRENELAPGQTQNINQGGAFVESELKVHFGERLQLVLDPQGAKLPAIGEVRWLRSPREASERSPAGFGIAFISVDKEALAQLIDERQA